MNILRFDSLETWLSATVSLWRDRLRLQPTLRHCLASGNTPIPIYRSIAESAQRGEVSFAGCEIFALDEFGGLAPDDPGRCKNMLERDLIGKVDVPKSRFHWLNPEAPDLEGECRAFDEAVGKGFDLVLLGIGTNGHLGMNEPGSAAESVTRRVDLHPSTISSSARYVAHARLPTWGLTVGMKQFSQAKEVWLVATGQSKAEIVRRMVHETITEQLPASLMRRHPNCWLFVDEDAGRLL